MSDKLYVLLSARLISPEEHLREQHNQSIHSYLLRVYSMLQLVRLFLVIRLKEILFHNHLCSIVLEQSRDRKSTRLNSSHVAISYAVFCLINKNRKYDS